MNIEDFRVEFEKREKRKGSGLGFAIMAGCVSVFITLAIYALLFAGGAWIIVKVLQHCGVI